MIQHPLPLQGEPAAGLDRIADQAIQLGHDIVQVSGFVDTLDTLMQNQLQQIGAANSAADAVARANASVRVAAEQMVASSAQSLAQVTSSAELIQKNSDRSHHVAEWVQTLDEQMRSVSDTLASMRDSAMEIGAIAMQVNILAINAKIEAARAGMAGRGFAVVANEIDRLSHRTQETTGRINTSIDGLTGAVDRLRVESADIVTQARASLAEASAVDAALVSLQSEMKNGQTAVHEIAAKADAVKSANDSFMPIFADVTSRTSATVEQYRAAKEQIAKLIDRSESVVQLSVSLGATTADSPMIALAQQAAAELSAAFEAALARGEVTEATIFDHRYTPISGTNPAQFMAPFTNLTDRIFTPVQEMALAKDSRIVFCAAVDKNGYLPTHNRKFSAPQGPDPVWNTANCRNRRIFDDRVGLGAGRNTENFLMQIYRRDMGGGVFAMMKDVSAPIRVNGRHWGGLRVAYKF